MIFKEYWGKAEATAKAFDADGFFLTGAFSSAARRHTGCFYFGWSTRHLRITSTVSPIFVLLSNKLDVPAGDTASVEWVAPVDSSSSNMAGGHGQAAPSSSSSGAQAGAAPGQQLLPYYSILGRTSVDIIKTGGFKVRSTKCLLLQQLHLGGSCGVHAQKMRPSSVHSLCLSPPTACAVARLPGVCAGGGRGAAGAPRPRRGGGAWRARRGTAPVPLVPCINQVAC